jgi:hypothetical protein
MFRILGSSQPRQFAGFRSADSKDAMAERVGCAPRAWGEDAWGLTTRPIHPPSEKRSSQTFGGLPHS